MRRYLRALSIGCLTLAIATAARAQEITATIAGTVTDQSGAALPRVTVVARNLGQGVTTEAATNKVGRYTLPYLTNGQYEITFSMPGFKPYVARNIDLHVSDRLEVGASLGLLGVTETVEVTASSEFIQQTPAVQTLMGERQVRELPLNNRNFVQLATLVPGVSSDLGDEVGVGLTANISISVNGARRNAVNWMVDGGSNVDAGSNITLLSTPTLESIEEFKIITSSYSAEWPRSGGGIINVVTKSGTNKYRGSAYEFFRNDALNANSFFRNMSTNPTIASDPPRLRYNNFGYTFGGPVKKDKLFAFWSQEWRRIQRAPASLTATVPDPTWLTDPASPNYVPPSERDPLAVGLLSAWPAPNVTGLNRYITSSPALQNTRQEVLRVDYIQSSKWRFMGRYTHDLSETRELGGLFYGIAVPNIATTDTRIPGQVAVFQVTTTINPSTLNEFRYQYSSNAIPTTNPEGTRNKRSDYGFTGSELFPENKGAMMPTLGITGISQVGTNQLYSNNYHNHSIVENLSMQRGNHSIKLGGLMTFEAKNESALANSQGSFSFVTGGGRTAFQNFLRGNRDGVCGTGCSYSEAESDLFVQLRFNRYELYVQDSWKMKPNVTLDYGLRYSLYPGVTEESNIMTSFDPKLYSRSGAPTMTSTGTVVVNTGDPFNGLVVAGKNSPGGDALYPTDKGNLQPRFGLTWNPGSKADMQVRGGFGIYYDQPLVGIFEQNAFTNPPYANTVSVQNPSLANPSSGTAPGTRGVRNLIASSNPFETPRTMQWNIGITRKLYSRGVVDIGYVGARGDVLIRPLDINQPQPTDVVAAGNANLARPYLGYGSINMRETTARSRYRGLIFNFRHDSRGAGLFNVAYTLSRNETDSTNDRDAVDFPQNPLNKEAEYAIARTDRTHILNVNWVYPLPFFKNSEGFVKQAFANWQISGIGTFHSGAPVPRITASVNASRRGGRANQVGDPMDMSTAPTPASSAAIYWFNPAAFSPPVDGTYGNSGRAIFRLPGRNQIDLTLAKTWNISKGSRLQFRADFINALNHTQFSTVDAACAVSLTTCVVAGDTFGTVTGTRAPREIQLGIKFYWN